MTREKGQPVEFFPILRVRAKNLRIKLPRELLETLGLDLDYIDSDPSVEIHGSVYIESYREVAYALRQLALEAKSMIPAISSNISMHAIITEMTLDSISSEDEYYDEDADALNDEDGTPELEGGEERNPDEENPLDTMPAPSEDEIEEDLGEPEPSEDEEGE